MFYFQYKFTASFVEIYNETLGDLLDGKKDKNTKLEIKMTGKSNVVSVTNLTTVPVTDQQQVGG
jgi:kinesin family protein C1